MRVIIVANSVEKDFINIYKKELNDYIITTDGSSVEALKLGITPDLAIGDFDSGELNKDLPNIKIYPKMKDETDLELALMEVKKLQ